MDKNTDNHLEDVLVKNSPTIIIRKEDVNNPLHPGLWGSWMDDAGLSMDTEEVSVKIVGCEP
jgi:hypothetical protein